MRLILSRKGMDSSYGGSPSPILPDGGLCCLPIPESGPDAALKGIPYSRIRAGGGSLGELVAQLTRWRVAPDRLAHLDPDLDRDALDREPGWLPVFGQAAAAEGHLIAQGVGPGDIFLFFAWFRQTILVRGELRFDPRAPDIHALYGWLQVGERISLTGGGRPPSWALRHPHCLGLPYAAQDSLYVAREQLELPGIAPGTIPGGGVGRRFDPSLQLTVPGKKTNRSWWRLPECFHRDATPRPLTYHDDEQRWSRDPDSPGQVLLRTVGRGQEFVLTLPDSPAAWSWVAEKMRILAGAA